MLGEFDEHQLRWENRLLPYIPDLPADSLCQASLYRESGGLGLLPARVAAVPAYVGSKKAPRALWLIFRASHLSLTWPPASRRYSLRSMKSTTSTPRLTSSSHLYSKNLDTTR